MTLTLTDDNKRDIAKTLSDVEPGTVAEAAVLWAANWRMIPADLDDADTTEEGVARLIDAQRAVASLTDAIWDGVKDGSITAQAKHSRQKQLSLAETFGSWLSDDERVEFGID